MWRVKVFALFFLLLYIPQAENSNILFVTISPSVSHQVVFQPIWKELSLRGHKVHVITPNPLNDPTLTNLTEIDVSSLYGELIKLVSPDTAKYLLKKPDFLTVFLKDGYMTKLFSQLNEKLFQHENVQKFLNNPKQPEFDVCVIEWLFPTMAGFAAKYNCTIVGLTSLGAPIPALDTVGNPSHPAYAPDHNLPLSREMSFKERLMSTLYAVYVRIYYHLVVLPREDALVKKYLGDDLPYLGDIERNISLLLLNRNPIFHRIYPTVPAIVELGGIQLNKTRKELEPELKKFVDNSKKGVIYFSLGSNMKSILLSNETREVFRKTFAQLPYNVVWKWEKGELPNKPPNVFTQSWIPQIALLEHPNVKLFLTQGGLQSTEDAIKNHVPIIGFPTHSDQTTNVDTCVHYGMGLHIDLDDVSVETLNDSIHKIMNDNSFHENAIKLDKLMQDRPFDSLERAIWWIEYAIRHQGAPHLESPAKNITWFNYFMLDIIGFFTLIILVLYYVISRIIKLILRLVCKLRTKAIVTHDKKTQ